VSQITDLVGARLEAPLDLHASSYNYMTCSIIDDGEKSDRLAWQYCVSLMRAEQDGAKRRRRWLVQGDRGEDFSFSYRLLGGEQSSAIARCSRSQGVDSDLRASKWVAFNRKLPDSFHSHKSLSQSCLIMTRDQATNTRRTLARLASVFVSQLFTFDASSPRFDSINIASKRKSEST
jgi:hypothetical protein